MGLAVSGLHALLMQGRGDWEGYFKCSVAMFYDYLVGAAGYRASQVHVMPDFALKKRAFREYFESFISGLNSGGTENGLVILYSGHGLKGRFFPHGAASPYTGLSALKRLNGRFLFINDSCHSGSVIPVLEDYGLLKEKGRVICSSTAGSKSNLECNFVGKVLAAASGNRHFTKKQLEHRTVSRELGYDEKHNCLYVKNMDVTIVRQRVAAAGPKSLEGMLFKKKNLKSIFTS